MESTSFLRLFFGVCFQIFPHHVYPVYQNVYQNAPGTRCAAAVFFDASTKFAPPCLPNRYLGDFDERRNPCTARVTAFRTAPPKGRYAPLRSKRVEYRRKFGQLARSAFTKKRTLVVSSRPGSVRYDTKIETVQCSSQTISAAISAGETPEMRLACPIFSGRISFSFWRASRRRPRICS